MIISLRFKLIILLLIPLFSRAFVNSPQVNCVSVLTNGDVTVNWTQPADPLSEFQSYNIFSSNSLNGSYTNVGTITNVASTSFTHVGANGNGVPKFYYVTTTSSDGTSQLATDTVRTIYLILNNPGNGIAYLQWNAISDPLHASSAVTYTVYREYPTGTFTALGTTATDKWKDTISLCSYFLNYRVEIVDANNCTSVSNVVGGQFGDLTAPSTPIIDSVSVKNSTNQTIMGISPSSSPDASCYIIYKRVGFVYIALDTVCGNTAITYTITGSAPNAASEGYAVASIDSCGNPSSISDQQATMFLSHNYSMCGKTVMLGWTPYIHMKNGLLKYKIYRSINGSTYTLIDDTTGLAYEVENLIPNKTYRFYIRAIDSTGSITSTSNIISFYSANQSQPTFVYIKSVSVNASEYIDIGVHVDTSVYIRGIEVFKSESPTGPFELIGYANSTGQPSYYITDADVYADSLVYYYKAVVIDSCGLESIESIVSRSILLSVTSNSDKTNSLSWTGYQFFLGGISNYKIYRSIDDVFDPVPIATVGASVNTYIDNVISLVPNAGRFDYYVEANEGSNNPYDIQESCTSNIVQTYHGDSIFIPSAFVPKGKNPVFLPVTQYVEKTEYKVSIYDRWGEKIWETQDDSEGWDGGNYEGGLYVYIVELKNAYGEYKRYNGTVLMIR